MRLAGWIFAAIATFVGVLGAVYFAVSGFEPVGSALLLGVSLLASMIGTYLLLRTNGVPPPPEDLPDATHADAAGVVGWFSPASIWPFVVGVAATVAAAGMAISAAALAFGLAVLLLAVLALAAEGWRR